MLRVTSLLALVVAACGDGSSSPAGDAAGDGPIADASLDGDASPDAPAGDLISIPFAARVDGAPFVCGQAYPDLGATNASYVGIDFRFFVHDVRVITPSGDVPVVLTTNAFQTAAGIALLDFETGGTGCQMGSIATHTAIAGVVPTGTTYSGVKLTIGVPYAKNHLDPTFLAPPMNVPPMFWAWSSGYKFIKVDGVANGQGFSLHLGSTGCSATGAAPPSAPCANPNTIDVTLADYVPGTSVIVADIAPVLAGADLTFNTTNTAQGCMSFPGDPECDTVMPRLGLPYGAIPAGTQQFLSVE